MARKSPAQDAVARQIEFSPIGRTRVQVTFDEPELSSDGGALLLREAARINGIIRRWLRRRATGAGSRT